jgi:hypothetical protein
MLRVQQKRTLRVTLGAKFVPREFGRTLEGNLGGQHGNFNPVIIQRPRCSSFGHPDHKSANLQIAREYSDLRYAVLNA